MLTIEKAKDWIHYKNKPNDREIQSLEPALYQAVKELFPGAQNSIGSISLIAIKYHETMVTQGEQQ